MTMVPVVCHNDGQRFKVAKVTTALRCITCGSDDLDLDDAPARQSRRRKLAGENENFVCLKCGVKTWTDDLTIIGRNCSATMFEEPHEMVPIGQHSSRKARFETDLPMGLVDEYQPEMGLLQERQPVAQKVRCSTCFYEGKIATAGPLPPCDNCGANTLSVAGATARRLASGPPSVDFGSVYGGDPAYQTPDGPVWMFRKGQAVRFYDAQGTQVGPEQSNVAPAVAYAHSQGWGGSYPTASVKVAEIAKGVLATNPGMNREMALQVARETVRRYPKVAGRSGHTVKQAASADLIEQADAAYDRRDQAWFNGLSTDDLVSLWASVSGPNLFIGGSWDDEVFDALAERGWFEEHGIDAPGGPTDIWSKAGRKTASLSVGDRVWVYGGGYGTITEGLHTPPVEMLSGGTGKVYMVQLDSGETRRFNETIVVSESDFGKAWHVYGPSGEIVAGGPTISRERAEEIAAEFGSGHTVKQGRKTADLNPADLDIEVGDIFDASWGYDQTNIDFYEVVGLTGASVRLREIGKRRVAGDGWTGKVVPLPGNYISEPFIKRIKGGWQGEPGFPIRHGWASKWNGEPVNFTAYASKKPERASGR